MSIFFKDSIICKYLASGGFVCGISPCVFDIYGFWDEEFLPRFVTKDLYLTEAVSEVYACPLLDFVDAELCMCKTS